MIALHVTAMVVVEIHKLAHEMAEVPLAKHSELVQALQPDRFDELFATTIQVRARLWQRIRSHILLSQLLSELLGELGIRIMHDDGRGAFAA